MVANKAVTWSSNNLAVTVGENGNINAAIDALRPDGNAVITATAGTESVDCNVTIVPWQANNLYLELDALLQPNTNTRPVLALDGSIYGVSGTNIVHTTDNFATTTALPSLPVDGSGKCLLFTPLGVFLRGTSTIYKSVDNLQTWTLCVDGLQDHLYPAFDYYYDGTDVYVFTGEYTLPGTTRHKVTRGKIEPDGTETWTTALEFYSKDEYAADNNNIPVCRHIHVVTVDPYTGNIYVGTGDWDHECHFMLSEDLGETWRVLGSGNQNWRTLSVWFTANYIYWNMDTSAPQSIWRLARTNLAAQAVGNDLKELVALLDNGALWYTCWAKEDNGTDVLILSSSPEGQIRDWNCRLFGIYEIAGIASVEELAVIESNTPDIYVPQCQLEPKFQSGDYVYFRPRGVADDMSLWRMKFRRNDP